MSSPLFSVVIPAYNVGAFLEETLASVLGQTCGDWELIVVDDGSTDDTAERLARMVDARLTVCHTANRGVSHARNLGLSLARGRYTALLDADDLWAPTHLAAAAAFFEEHPEVPWWASAWYIGREGVPAVPAAESSRVARYFGAPSLAVCSSTVVLRAEAAKALLPLFPEEMGNAEDWAAWARFASHHPLIGFCPQADTLYRLRVGSATAAVAADELVETLMALPRFLRSLEGISSPEALRYVRYRMLQRWLVLFSRGVPKGWQRELVGQKALLGARLYWLLRWLAPWASVSRRGVCKILHELNQMQERAIRRTS